MEKVTTSKIPFINAYTSCNTCKSLEKDASKLDNYLAHLMFSHKFEEITQIEKYNPTLSNLINVFPFTSTININPNVINLNQNLLQPTYKQDWKVSACLLCENAVNDEIKDLEFHLLSMHNVTKCDNSNFIYGFFNAIYNITLETEYVTCKDCGIVLENNQINLDYHKDFHLFGNKKNPSKENIEGTNKMLNRVDYTPSYSTITFYCCLCQKIIDKAQETFHLHFSFLNCEVKDNDLITAQLVYQSKNPAQFLGNIGGINNINNSNNINTMWNANPNTTSSIALDVNNVSGQVPVQKNPEVELKLKEWELYSSLSRPVDSKLDEEFRNKFQPRMFEYVDIIGSKYNTHCYSKEEKASTATLLKRLNTEFTKLQVDLPCNLSSSYFIRADVNYPQFIKVLIAGSRGTPYEHGLFEYDIYIPSDYPNGVPKCILKTTGGGKIRFNPNLYNNGTVCLSLLGTWPGMSVEKWDPKTSNLYQVFISLSSLVMNDRIIENEPGFENYLNASIQGLEENEGYANIVRIGNISYAMIDMINNPPLVFDSLVKDYFAFISKEILADINIWLDRYSYTQSLYTGLTLSHNPDWAGSLHGKAYETHLKKKIDELNKLIS